MDIWRFVNVYINVWYCLTDLPYLMFPLLYVSNTRNTLCHVVWAGDHMHWCFWNIHQVIWSLKWALWPHMNILLLFLVVERGLNSYSMSLHQICMPIIAKQRSDMYQKIILNRDIAIWSFISVLIWKQNLHFILLLIANNVIYVKCLFLGSVVPHMLIWDSPYCRGMICYLCFRRHVRFTNIIAIYMYCIVLLFITMIFVALRNRYMWKVQNSTILEG